MTQDTPRITFPLAMHAIMTLTVAQAAPRENPPATTGQYDSTCLIMAPAGLCIRLDEGWVKIITSRSTQVVMTMFLAIVVRRLSTSMKARYGCAGDMLTSFQYVTRKGSPLLESRRPRYLAHASPSRTRIYSGAGLARTSRYCAEMIKNPLILCGFMTLEKYAGKLFSPFSRNSLKRRSHKA